MSEVYEIKSVSGPKEWQGQHGPMYSYKLDLDNNGVLERQVELNRKPESRAPEVGELIAVDLEEGAYGTKAKLDFERTKELHQGGSQTSSRGSSEARSGHVPTKDMDASIAIQVALKVLSPKINSTDKLTDAQKIHAGEIQRFILETGQASSQAEGSHASPEAATAATSGGSPRSDQAPADEQQWAEHRLEGGLDSAGVTDPDERQWLIKAWREMPPKDGLSSEERRNIAMTSITSQDLESQSSALKRLRELAGPMPDSFRTDSVVF